MKKKEKRKREDPKNWGETLLIYPLPSTRNPEHSGLWYEAAVSKFEAEESITGIILGKMVDGPSGFFYKSRCLAAMNCGNTRYQTGNGYIDLYKEYMCNR